MCVRACTWKGEAGTFRIWGPSHLSQIRGYVDTGLGGLTIPSYVLYLNSFCNASLASRPGPPPSSEDCWLRGLVRATLTSRTRLQSRCEAGPSTQHAIPLSKNEVSLW